MDSSNVENDGELYCDYRRFMHANDYLLAQIGSGLPRK